MQSAELADKAGDPAEDMMKVPTRKGGNVDAINSIAVSEQARESMDTPSVEAVATQDVASSVSKAEVKAEQPGGAAGAVEAEPVILDASKVRPEDAAAINAVAVATSEAMAGTSRPVEKSRATTLEESVKEMLKPMIREWLDDNMPRILGGVIEEEVKSPEGDDR